MKCCGSRHVYKEAFFHQGSLPVWDNCFCAAYVGLWVCESQTSDTQQDCHVLKESSIFPAQLEY